MKTDWFPADVKPVRPGWYEVQRFVSLTHLLPMEPHMLEWTGTDWRYAYEFRRSDAGDFASMRASDGDMWRGLKAPYEPAQEG